MSDATLPRPGVFRAALLALGAVQAYLGAYALFFPRGFFDDFPFGAGWVEALPAYNEHLVRDVGGLFLLSAAVLIAAGVYLQRRLVAIALGSFLLFTVPHTVFHLFNLEPYGTADVIANVVALASQVVIPLALLWLLARPPAPRSKPTAARSHPASGNGRVEGVGDRTRNPVVRYAFRESRRRGDGEVLDPIRVFAHNPTIMFGYGMLELATERSQRLPERLKHLAGLRAAMLCGCEWCLDYGSAISAAHEVAEDDLRALPAYRESERFDRLECLVLDYASGMSRTPAEVSDELFAELADHLDPGQLVELTNAIAIENYRARFNWAFGLAGQGYADGAYCVRPEDGGATAERGGRTPAERAGRMPERTEGGASLP